MANVAVDLEGGATPPMDPIATAQALAPRLLRPQPPRMDLRRQSKGREEHVVRQVDAASTEDTKAASERALDQTYQVFTISDEQSAATLLGLGLVNALIIVCVIGVMTFVIVLLYKYRCMNLEFLGRQMFVVATDKYRLEIDQYRSILPCTTSRLSGRRPCSTRRAYLVATSVIIAWQLSYFNTWMAWALLIMLALYDLCDMLTPCSPLKALVKQTSKENAPGMPGLMYEAGVPISRPTGLRRKRKDGQNAKPGLMLSKRHRPKVARVILLPAAINLLEKTTGATMLRLRKVRDRHRQRWHLRNGTMVAPFQARHGEMQDLPEIARRGKIRRKLRKRCRRQRQMHREGQCHSRSPWCTNCPSLPLAPWDGMLRWTDRPRLNICSRNSAPIELRSNVEVTLPRNGGRIDATRNQKGEPCYVVYNRDGEIKRTLLVDERGKVLEIVPREEGDEAEPGNIKLGLVGFIFYSILVSKAAEDGFAIFAVCFLAILAEPGGTLILLAFFHKALPVLPTSIFLAVVGFVLT
ncbi:hypothetical protein ACHAWF_006039, partial [Thalassiosira exigua]